MGRCRWSTVNAVNKLWLATIDGLVMRLCPAQAHADAHGVWFHFYECNDLDDCRPDEHQSCFLVYGFLEGFKRNPDYACRILYLDIVSHVEKYTHILRDFTGLRGLDIGPDTAAMLQFLSARQHSPFAFLHLDSFGMHCKSGMSEDVEELLAGLLSLKYLTVTWEEDLTFLGRFGRQRRVQKELGRAFAKAQSVRYLKLTLPTSYDFPDLAALLPGDLRVLRLKCSSKGRNSLAAALVRCANTTGTAQTAILLGIRRSERNSSVELA